MFDHRPFAGRVGAVIAGPETVSFQKPTECNVVAMVEVNVNSPGLDARIRSVWRTRTITEDTKPGLIAEKWS